MKVYLMHKNIITARIEVSLNGDLSKVELNNENFEHLPLGCQMNNMKFHKWWEDRAVPKTRKGVKHALRELDFSSTACMLVQNLALSLNDCYWIKPADSNYTWENVSLFRNNFIDIFGELTFDTRKHLSNQIKQTRFLYVSSAGELQKKWCIDNNNNRFLVKGNWDSSYQQSLNEIFTTLINKYQDFNNYTSYSFINVKCEDDKDALGCYSYNFCNEDIEFISAWELLQTVKLGKNDSYFNKLLEVCKNIGISDIDFNKFLSYEIMMDYLISNTDRHMNNLGILRNPNTLEVIGFAPIYDNGNSMFFRTKNLDTVRFNTIETHSFLKFEKSLLKLVKYRDLLDLDKLPNYNEFIKIYSNDIPERINRYDKVWDLFQRKISVLRSFQEGNSVWKRRNLGQSGIKYY